MPEPDKPAERNAEETKARIVASAQRVFAAKAYSQAGLREIARHAGVAGSLVIKYFGTKRDLFEEALRQALIDPRVFQEHRSRFGATVVGTIDDPTEDVFAPAMIALSIGDDEAKGAIERVTEQQILGPMAAWLGPPDAGARANYILMLTMGYVVFARHLATGKPGGACDATAELVARGLQAAVDAR
jgi:AcrR family transcriptional regulator